MSDVTNYGHISNSGTINNVIMNPVDAEAEADAEDEAEQSQAEPESRAPGRARSRWGPFL